MMVFKSALRKVARFLKSHDGPAAVEYAVCLSLIVAVALPSIGILGGKVSQQFESVSAQFDVPGGGGTGGDTGGGTGGDTGGDAGGHGGRRPPPARSFR